MQRDSHCCFKFLLGKSHLRITVFHVGFKSSLAYMLTIIAVVVLAGCELRMSIHDAAGTGNIEAVKQHLAAGIDVNAKDNDRLTALHHTVLLEKREPVDWGNKEIAGLLTAQGADVNVKADKGFTPLDVAIQRKHTGTADLLRKHGGKTGEELKADGE